MKNFIQTGRILLTACFLSSALVTATKAEELDENCVVNILNRTIQVAEDGGWSLPNVPSNQGAVRARATCVGEEGTTLSGQSGYFNLRTNGITRVGEIQFVEQEPVPVRISFLTTIQISLTALGQTYQLDVTAEYPGGLLDNVTAATSGTNYTSSNSAVASVNANGLISAVGSGNALITASKDGQVATRLVRVSFTGDQDGDGLPDDYESANGLDPNDPADAFEDRDNDGLSALDEYLAGTDIDLADTDGDGIDDGEELIEGEDGFITNALLADSDGDGLSDFVEVTLGSSPTDSSEADYQNAITAISVVPNNVVMTFNGIDSEVSTQLTVTATVLDGTSLDVTAKSNGTSYQSSDLATVSFGITDGQIFGGAEGNATVTVSLFDLSVEVPVTVESFQPAGIATLSFSGTAYDNDVQGDYVYIAAGSAGLHIVDTSDKTNPEIVSTLATSGTARDVKVVGTYAFVAVANAGLDIINIADVSQPTLVSNIGSNGIAVDLAAQNSHIFVANESGGFEIFNVEDVSAPFSVAKLDNLGKIIGVDVSNDRAVVANSSAVIVLDISDLASPMRLGSINIGNIRAVVMDGDYAYVACYTCGYKVINLSDPMRPTIVGGDTRFYPSDVELTNGFAFFSDILFVNAVPFVNIADPENSIFQGVIDIRQFGDRDANSLSIDAGFVYSTATNRLYISQYRILNDNQGIAPSVEVISPPDGDVVVEGSRILVRAEATDDVAVATVQIRVNGTLVASDTTRPYEVPISVPAGITSMNILVEAVDFGNNVGDDLALLTVEPDEDGDGLGDNEEVFTWNTDPENPDSDGDGLIDGLEIELATDPLDTDSDDDERTDGDEVAAGTDPLNPDVTPPEVSSVDPADAATDICENSNISVIFNEAILRRSLTDLSIQLIAEDTTVLTGIQSLTTANTELIFNPTNLLADNSSYTIEVSGVRDEAGNPLAETFTSTFTTGNCVDEERPTLIDISPVNGSSNIPVNAVITAILSEPIDPVTVTEDTMYVVDQSSGQRIGGILDIAENNSAISFIPNVPLLVGRRHYVYLTSGIQDTFNNPFVGTSRWFDTSFDIDGSGPQVVATSMLDEATDIPVNVQPAVRFNEAVNALYLTQIQLLNSVGAEVAVSRSLSNDRRRVVLSPVQNLNANESYTLWIDGVQDLSGNLLANPIEINFMTSDVADTVTGSAIRWSIPNNSRDVARNPLLAVDFSEAIDPSSVNSSSFYLYDSSTNLSVAGQRILSEDGRRLTFVPNQPLRENHLFYLYVGYSPYLQDLAGNLIAQNNYHYFYTGRDLDNETLAVSASNLGMDNDQAPLNSRVVLYMDQIISDSCPIADAVQLVTGEEQIAVDTALANDRRTITITPQENLTALTEYTLTLDGLCDYAGNASETYQLSFTTQDVETTDTTGPALLDISPANATSDIDVTTQVVLTYDEPVDLRSAPPITGAGITVPGSYQVNGAVITFTPDILLPGSTRFTVELYYNVPDLAGNTRYGGTRYFDTQAVEDTQVPSVLAISPVDMSSDIHPAQNVVLSFDEPVNLNTLNANNLALFYNGSVLSSNIFRSADGRQVTLSASLPHSAIVSVVMTDGVQDLAGNAIVPFVSSFTTGVADTDNTRPRIIAQTPVNGSSGWTDINQVYFYTDEAVDESTLADAFNLAEDGVLAQVEIDVLGDGRTIRVTKDTDFNDNALIQLYWDSSVLDLSGNPLHAHNSYFNTSTTTDNLGIRPRVESYFPNNGSRGTPLNAIILTRFSEEMDLTSFTSESAILYNVTDNWSVMPRTITLDDTGRIAQVVADDGLVADNQYYLWFSTALLDTDGDNLQGNSATYFYTDADSIVDDAQPTVAAMSPPDGESNVGTNAWFATRFSEQINPITFAAEGAINVQFAENNQTVRYNMLQPLASESEITAMSPEMADLAGNMAVGSQTQFTTTTGPDFVQPSVTDVSVFNNQQDIALNSAFEWTFSEPIDPISVTSSGVYIYDNVDRVTIASSYELSADGKRLILMPDQALLAGRQYYIYAYYMRDLAGNNLGNHYRYFTTGFAEDVVAPEVVNASIIDGQTELPTNVRLNVRFNEMLNPLDLDGIVLTDSSGQVVPVHISLNRGRRLVSLVPRHLLAPMQDYLLTIEGVSDLSNNQQVETLMLNFTTGATVDLTAGSIVRWSIPNNTRGVALNPNLEVHFSEPVDKATIDTDTFYLYDNDARISVAGDWTLSEDGLTLNFVPDEALRPNHLHYFYVGYSPYLHDYAGNRVGQNNYHYFYTGDSADEAAPELEQISVVEGDTDVPVNGRVVIVLSERLSDTCQIAPAFSLTTGGEAIDIQVSMENDRRTLTIQGQQNLQAATEYQLAVNGICDYSGNELAQTLVNFTTLVSADADSSGPSLSTISPIHQATEVEVELTEIVMTFDEAIDARSRPPVTGGGITIPGQYTVEENVITFVPAITLAGNTRYTIELYYNVPDLAGNTRYLGTRYFNTQEAADSVAPTVSAISPAADSVDVNPAHSVVLSFSEPMLSSSINNQNIALYANGVVITPSVFRSADGRDVTVSASLPHASLVSVIVTENVQDLAGNAVAPFISSFTTGTVTNDVTRPTIVTQIPANGSSNWIGLEEITLYASEPLTLASIDAAIKVTDDGVLLPVDVALMGDGRTIRVTPTDGNFPDSSRISLYLDSSVVDTTGNALQTYSSYVNTSVATDGVGAQPTIVAYHPVNNTAGVPLNPILTAQFTEPLDSSTFGSETIILYDVTDNWTVLASSAELDATGTIIRVTPDAALVADNQYYVWYSNAIKDTDGDNLRTNYATYFNTAADAVADDRQPMISSLSPPDQQTGVGVNTLFAVRFDEPMNPLTFDYAGGVNISVQFSENNQVVIYRKLTPLPSEAEHTETFAGMLDMAENQVVEDSTTFTTLAGPDFVRPELVDVAYSNNQQDVATNPVVEWIFNEPIDPVSVTASGVYMYNNTTRETIASSSQLSADGMRLTTVPDEALDTASQYYVYAYYMRDLSGNTLGNHYRYFTTGAAADETAPTVVSTSVTDGQTGIPVNLRFNVRFSESLNPLVDNAVSLQTALGVDVPVNLSLSRGRTLLTIVPKQLLMADTDYSLTVTGLKDISGNTLATDLVVDFTTSDTGDFHTSGVAHWGIPNNNTQGVALNPLLQVHFAERVDKTTIDGNTFYLWDNTDRVTISSSWDLTADGLTLTLTPDDLLTAEHTYYLYVGYSPYLTDLSGNRIATNNYKYFVTGTDTEADETAPAVSRSNIATGETDMPINGQLVLEMSEPLSGACILANGIDLTLGGEDVATTLSLTNGRNILTVKAAAGFATESSYQLALTDICDYAGNKLTDYTLSFTTNANSSNDTGGPTLQTITPEHNSTGIAVGSNIVLDYDETLDLRAAPLLKQGGNLVAVSYTVNGSQITLDPDEDLQANTQYVVELYNYVPDLVGNTRNGGTRTFTTAE
ncbi:Ig-like domain-containing protein [Catenovulum agarivorans]|uniref:Ig-like domain-containing protein n=1 Tax=Catenovulum agarivorans TaxID=1172192 RepID=UPI00030F6B89|nr:Ig-like domain-containing protein [Catenovulum agarivorans]